MNGADGWGNPGDMGIPILWDLDSSTGKVAGSPGDLRLRAQSQIDAAKRGEKLDSMRAETHPNRVWTGPADDVEAYYKVAYWLGTGARMLQARGRNGAKLVAAADHAINKGYRISLIPFYASKDHRKIAAVMAAGANIAAQAGLSDVAQVLGATGTKQAIGTSQQRQTETQFYPSAVQQSQQAAEGAAQVIETAAGLVTGNRPTGMSDWAWFWRKWGLRIALGSGVVIVGAIVLRPYLGAVQGVTRRGRRGYY